MTWAELYAQLNIPRELQLQNGANVVPDATVQALLPNATTTPPATPPAATPTAIAPFSLAQLYPGLAGSAPTGMANVSFGGAIPADQQAASALTWAQFLQARQQWEQQFGLQQQEFGLQQATFDQNKYQYGNDFAEAQRRYNQDFNWSQFQDSRNFTENTRQFQTQFDEAKRRYDQEFPWLQKRDAWSIAGASFLPNARFLTR